MFKIGHRLYMPGEQRAEPTWDDAVKACAAIANEVRVRAAENAATLLQNPHKLRLEQLKEIDFALAGQRHATQEIETAIRRLAANRPAPEREEP